MIMLEFSKRNTKEGASSRSWPLSHLEREHTNEKASRYVDFSFFFRSDRKCIRKFSQVLSGSNIHNSTITEKGSASVHAGHSM